MITFNPENSDDLGRAIKTVSALEMEIIIPHVANILEELAKAELTRFKFKYAFELYTPERRGAEFAIQVSSQNLPPHVCWYECDGKRLFEMRGPSGGIVTSVICYLITK